MNRPLTEVDPKINQEAGFKLLTHFQDRWQQMHENSEICSKKADAAMKKLDRLEQSSSKLLTCVQLLIDDYQSMNQLDERLGNIQEKLDGLFGCFDQIETLLTTLRNNNEAKELERFQRQLEEDTDWSIRERTIKSEVSKKIIENEHKRRVQEYEQKHDKGVEERRKLFEKAFEEEKSKYLQNLHGNSS